MALLSLLWILFSFSWHASSISLTGCNDANNLDIVVNHTAFVTCSGFGENDVIYWSLNQTSGRAYQLPDCSNNTLTVADDTETQIRCTDIGPFHNNNWSLVFSNGTELTVAECSHCNFRDNPCECTVSVGNYTAERAPETSVLRFTGVKEGAVVRCSKRDGRYVAQCRISVEKEKTGETGGDNGGETEEEKEGETEEEKEGETEEEKEGETEEEKEGETGETEEETGETGGQTETEGKGLNVTAVSAGCVSSLILIALLIAAVIVIRHRRSRREVTDPTSPGLRPVSENYEIPDMAPGTEESRNTYDSLKQFDIGIRSTYCGLDYNDNSGRDIIS